MLPNGFEEMNIDSKWLPSRKQQQLLRDTETRIRAQSNALFWSFLWFLCLYVPPLEAVCPGQLVEAEWVCDALEVIA